MSAGGISADAEDPPLVAGPKAEIPSVDWWITSRCNLACDFCYGPVPAKDPVELGQARRDRGARIGGHVRQQQRGGRRP